MVQLFPASEIFVPEHPEEHGFYELELPDAFRWIKQDAKVLVVCRAHRPPFEPHAQSHCDHRAQRMLSFNLPRWGTFSGPSGLTDMAHIIFICRPSL